MKKTANSIGRFIGWCILIFVGLAVYAIIIQGVGTGMK